MLRGAAVPQGIAWAVAQPGWMGWLATSTSPLDTAEGRCPSIPQRSDGHHEFQGCQPPCGRGLRAFRKDLSLSFCFPRRRRRYLQVEANCTNLQFALAVWGELYKVPCRLGFLPFSCPLLVLWMGKL